MADQPPTYIRLPGGGGSGFARYRLWLGPDHLLQVASTAVGERYRRFYFADIQAFVLRRSRSRFWWGLFWLVLTIGAGVLVLAMDEPIARGFFGGTAGACALGCLLSLLFGRNCLCTVRTAVQTEEVPSLRRLRVARKVLARLRPLIEASQGVASPAPETSTPATSP